MRKITVRRRALRTCAHSQARTHTLAQPGLWVEVAEGIVRIEEGGAEHCASPRRKLQQLDQHGARDSHMHRVATDPPATD